MNDIHFRLWEEPDQLHEVMAMMAAGVASHPRNFSEILAVSAGPGIDLGWSLLVVPFSMVETMMNHSLATSSG